MNHKPQPEKAIRLTRPMDAQFGQFAFIKDPSSWFWHPTLFSISGGHSVIIYLPLRAYSGDHTKQIYKTQVRKAL